MKLKPRALTKGSTVGIIAPASPAYNPSTVRWGEEALEEMGFQAVLGESVLRAHRYLAGTDQERLADLMDMFENDRIDAVFCLRGGYGSMRFLSQIDYRVVRANPKVFLGYSDITALHLAINKMAGLVTFHGPMVASNMASGLTDYTRVQLMRALLSPEPIGRIANPQDGPRVLTITPGIASGRLIGGNLSLVVSTLGTSFEIETEGRILFLEEVNEEPYRIDRALTQLELAGKLQAAAGIVFGESVNCEPKEYKPAFMSTFSLEEVLYQILGGLGIPCIYGLAIGHGRDKATLPIGVEATLDATHGQLILDEAATVPATVS